VKIRIKKSDIRGAVRAVLRERLEEQVGAGGARRIEDVPGFSFPVRVPFEFEIENYDFYDLEPLLTQDMRDPGLIEVENVTGETEIVEDPARSPADPQNPKLMQVTYGQGVIAFLPEFFENAMLMLHHPSEGVDWSWDLIEKIMNSGYTSDYIDERFVGATGVHNDRFGRYVGPLSWAKAGSYKLELKPFKRPGAAI